MHKRYEDYRFQVMYQHPKLSEDPDKFECYYETNFIDHAKYYAITLLGKGCNRLCVRQGAEPAGAGL